MAIAIMGGAAQGAGRYGLEVVDSIAEYRRLVQLVEGKRLVDLQKEIPSLFLDIQYATDDNFTGKTLYGSPRAFLRSAAARALKGAQAEFNGMGLGIKVFDAYRPYSITVTLWDFVEDERYVAAPWKGSRHNRGCAVDMTLVDLESGEELAMPTGYDDFSEKAHLAFNDLPVELLGNRRLLLQVMGRHGFTALETEWWHFDCEGWQAYEIVDLPFELLDES